MKKIFSFIFFLFSIHRIFATGGGPDLYGYTWSDSASGGPGYHWIDILPKNAIAIKSLGDDNTQGPFPMNFNFHYYWYDVNQFWVGSNGYILFQNGQIASPFPDFPNIALPNDVIGPFMDDFTFDGNGNIGECYYWVNPAHDTLIVSWIDVPFWNPSPPFFSGRNSFQLILSAIDNSITFQYRDQTGNPFGTFSSSSGIENYTGAIGLSCHTAQLPPVHYAVKFYYPVNPNFQIPDVSVIYNSNPDNGAVFLPSNGSPFILSATISNTGLEILNPFQTLGAVLDENGATLASSYVLSDTLHPGQKEDLTFPQSFQPIIPGTYRFISQTRLPIDLFNFNDTLAEEVIVVDTSQPAMRLTYHEGNVTPNTQINWTGGYGGAGLYFAPPFYPVEITELHYYTESPGVGGFSCRVYDDDGAFSAPNTLLDSVYVGAAQVTINNWTDVKLSKPIVISSGGFYVEWDMNGAGAQLGALTTALVSNRSYEVFGMNWGIYRFRQTQDPLIDVTIQRQGVEIGIATINQNDFQFQLYPNPSNGDLNISLHENNRHENFSLKIFDLQGRMIREWNLGNLTSGTQYFRIDLKSLPPGMYVAECSTGNERNVKKLVIAK